MDYEATVEAIVAAFLVALLVFFSLDFDRHYADGIHDAARHPFLRFLAGLGVAIVAARNPVLASLALVVVFFWIADVSLLSSFSV
jgi:hypothetical protein